MDVWTAEEVQPDTWILYRNGKEIVDDHGRPHAFPSKAAAFKVAEDWDLHRAPTFAELRAMTDEELQSRSLGG